MFENIYSIAKYSSGYVDRGEAPAQYHGMRAILDIVNIVTKQTVTLAFFDGHSSWHKDSISKNVALPLV